MKATAYEGYFSNGRFYASGKIIKIPEQRRIFITILNEMQDDTVENGLPTEINRNKSDLLLPPSLDTRGWKFDREEANER